MEKNFYIVLLYYKWYVDNCDLWYTNYKSLKFWVTHVFIINIC